MKNILSTAIIAFLFFGCSKQQVPSPSKIPGILNGNWKTTSDTIQVYKNGNIIETDVLTGNPMELYDYNFDNDSTVAIANQAGLAQTTTATYKIENDTITFIHPDLIGQPGYINKAFVKEHTANKLVMLFDVTHNGNGNTEIMHMTK